MVAISTRRWKFSRLHPEFAAAFLACGADSNIAGGDDVQFARDLPNTIQSRQIGSAVYLGRCNQSTELLYDYGADPNIEVLGGKCDGMPSTGSVPTGAVTAGLSTTRNLSLWLSQNSFSKILARVQAHRNLYKLNLRDLDQFTMYVEIHNTGKIWIKRPIKPQPQFCNGYYETTSPRCTRQSLRQEYCSTFGRAYLNH
ncbi:hypothetical protein B0H13DRAFT_1885627 [Mycena leptocephala]|nr:hypothetical protein B0H13DRAFT_1885627 [Mycena leptocephala]